MLIAHISDIHWLGLGRHEEYTKAFKELFMELKKRMPDLIFVGGDLFHTKTSGISPEVIDRLTWMLRSMGDIANTKIILGNHDANLHNADRQDIITSIVTALNHPRVSLYSKSGVYRIDDVFNLCVFSCVDKDGWSNVKPQPGKINIGAFHGSVGGCLLDNGSKLLDSKAEVQLSMFDGFDFALLGDIHTRQVLARRADKNGEMKPWIAYPGSFIQQNFGESLVKGIYLWDIKSRDQWDLEFLEVKNNQPFLTIPWQEADKTLESLKLREINPGTRLRIQSDLPINPSIEKSFKEKLQSDLKVGEVIFQSKKKLSYNLLLSDESTEKQIHKASLRNDPETIISFYREFLKENGDKSAYKLSESELEACEGMIQDYLKRLNLEDESETTRDIYWSIKSIEFNNLFKYGSGNIIDFERFGNGSEGTLIGILGNNKVGKSSLIGALMYALFNTADREGITKNGWIMNQSKDSCSAKVVISVNGSDYMIERSSTRVGKKVKGKEQADKTETKVNFVKLNPDGTTEKELNGISRDETDKIIRKLIGSPQDFLLTSIATQSKMERFVDEGATSRKLILNRFLDLDIFDKLYQYVKDDLAVYKNALKNFPTLDWEEHKVGIQNAIEVARKELKIIEDSINEKKLEEFNLNRWIEEKEPSNMNLVLNALNSLKQDEEKKKRELRNIEEELKELGSSNIQVKNYISQLEKMIVQEQAGESKEDLKLNLDKLLALQENMKQILLAKKEKERIVEEKEKSIRKLALVPCGDSFPECRYIKDSHEDKKGIEIEKANFLEILKQLETLTLDLNSLKERKYQERFAKIQDWEKKIPVLQKELQEKEKRLQTLENSLLLLGENILSTQNKKADLERQIANEIDIPLINERKIELSELRKVIYNLERKKSNTLQDIGRLREKLEKAESDSKEVEKNLTGAKLLETIQGAFHKNGIPTIVLKTQLPAINYELKQLLGGIVDFSIVFQAEPGTSNMDVFIEDDHSKRILELGSGMEKMIASIALRVALINVSSLPKSDIFVIDEGFNALDEKHIDKCLSLLQALKNQFKSIVIISHMDRVKETVDSIIEVYSTKDGSRIA